MKKVSKAIVRVLRKHPFYGHLLLQFPIVADESIPTACTNGVQIKYSPKFFEEISDEMVEKVLEHEVLHIVLQHLPRLGNRDMLAWNIVTDLVIEHIQNGEQKIPSAEELYHELMKKVDQQKKKGANGGSGNGNNKNKGQSSTNSPLKDEEAKKAVEKYKKGDGGEHQIAPAPSEQAYDDVTKKIVRAATQAKMDGSWGSNLPDPIKQIINKLIAPPKVRWQDVLASYLTNHPVSSWSMPNRRFISQGLYLPGKAKLDQMLDNVVICLDVSGSISQEDMHDFISEVLYLLREYKLQGTILQFDVTIRKVDAIEESTEPESISFRFGDGGTDFNVIFSYLSNEMINPSLVIIFTDGDGPYPKPDAVDVPTIWVINNENHKAPFGVTVSY